MKYLSPHDTMTTRVQRSSPKNPVSDHRRHALRAIFASAAAAVLTGCVASPGPRVASAEDDDRAALLQRARTYWKHVREGDFVSAWPYEDISRDPNWTLQSYLKRVGGIVYHHVEVSDDIQEDGDAAAFVRVRQRVSVPLARLPEHEVVVQDRWRRIDGVWYHDRSWRPPMN